MRVFILHDASSVNRSNATRNVSILSICVYIIDLGIYIMYFSFILCPKSNKFIRVCNI